MAPFVAIWFWKCQKSSTSDTPCCAMLLALCASNKVKGPHRKLLTGPLSLNLPLFPLRSSQNLAYDSVNPQWVRYYELHVLICKTWDFIGKDQFVKVYSLYIMKFTPETSISSTRGAWSSQLKIAGILILPPFNSLPFPTLFLFI